MLEVAVFIKYILGKLMDSSLKY